MLERCILAAAAVALSACGDTKDDDSRPASGSSDRVYFEQATYATVESTLQVRLYVAHAGGAAASVDFTTRLTGSADTADFEEETGHQLMVRVTDSGGLTHDRAVAVGVIDVNESPWAEANTFTVKENAPD